MNDDASKPAEGSIWQNFLGFAQGAANVAAPLLNKPKPNTPQTPKPERAQPRNDGWIKWAVLGIGAVIVLGIVGFMFSGRKTA